MAPTQPSGMVHLPLAQGLQPGLMHSILAHAQDSTKKDYPEGPGILLLRN